MRPRHHLARSITVLVAASVLVLAAAVPGLAKEGIETRLDAPIAGDTPGGTELLLGLTATVQDGSVARMVEGTPFYVRLTGPDGETTRALTTSDPETGHYTALVVVPASGVVAIEIGIAGSTDVPVMVVGEPIVAGGITADTAQAPPVAAPAAPAAVPAADLAGAVSGTRAAGSAYWLAAIALIAVIALVALAASRRARVGRGVAGARGVPDA